MKWRFFKNRKKSMKSRADFFVKVIKNDNPLARLTKKKRERTQINEIRDVKEKLQRTPQNYKAS